ncbi:hypothetical protein DEO72_LG6g3149 [Vigna unguiculata]|uniref:GATA-type domain-containing protein n=1 Tax=Vigna unguiculata TaxID=3917 RepID=A0A4D6MDK3_VIGUN|nr:hypothetical protein DEO72_LG6g3149 [Vigna unguiculata]
MQTLCNACGIRYRKRGSCSRKREEVVVLHRTSSVVKKQRWKMLGEEEQAAVCLMALSCGFFTIPSLTAFQGLEGMVSPFSFMLFIDRLS